MCPLVNFSPLESEAFRACRTNLTKNDIPHNGLLFYHARRTLESLTSGQDCDTIHLPLRPRSINNPNAFRRHAPPLFQHMKRTIIAIALSGTAMLAAMITIFLFSNQSGGASSETSDHVAETILGILDVEIPTGQPPSTVPILFEFNVRNCAHIFLYALLGLTAFLFAASLFALAPKKRRLFLLWIVLAALAISLAYACFDELHQSYVDGRNAALRDVGIDMIGACTAGVLSCAVYALIRHCTRKQHIE